MDITVADVQALALENFLLRRDLDRAVTANEQLRRQIEQADDETIEPGGTDGD